ncbi:MAG: hypothetical protein J7K47_00860 [Thermoplasmata archaeon]|nr:hypothetical protein [Thermoplasmata archaeon]
MKAKFLILLAIFMAGCLTTPYRHGFDENDVVAPTPYHVEWQEKPKDAAIIPPGYSYELNVTIPRNLYPNYWNALEIAIKNNGNTKLFIYNIAIEIDGNTFKQWDGKEGKEIGVGEKKSFIASFKVSSPGEYRYRIGVYFMAASRKWYDYGCKYTQEYEISIDEYSEATNYKFHKNYYVYFDKIKKLVDPCDNIVKQRANIASSGYGYGYNIAKVCAIFDYIKDNMKYVNDSDDKDIWNSPSVALLNGGDCEEFAMTMAAMTMAKGGTARIYMTDNHAFAAIYIGKDLGILDSIDSYYHAKLSYALFEDKLGYWIVADMLSSFYLGCLPVGGYATGESNNERVYEWSIATNNLYAIDVVG